MKQTYIKPNTILMNLCGEFAQVICASNPSLPGAPETGTEYQFGTGGNPAPKKA